MKKFFTLIVAFMATLFSANAAEVVLFDGSAAIGWGGTKLDVSGITEDTGLTLHVTIETTSGDWWQFKFVEANVEGWPYIQLVEGSEYVNASNVKGYSWSAGTYTYDFELTDEQIAKIKGGVAVQGSISNDKELDPAPQLLLKKVTVESKVNYKDAIDLTDKMDQYGNIEAKNFNGFSDDAVVEFTWNSENTSGVIGWGSGSLKSIDGTVDLKEGFTIQSEGTNVVTKKLGSLKDALNAGPDTYNRYGLYWNMWGCNDTNKNTRVSIKVYEVEGFEGEGYLSPDSQVTPPSGDPDKKDGYKDPVDLTEKMDQYGNIESKNFNGFSDDAVIVFTWESTGDDVKVNWGAGSLKSIDGTVDLEEGFTIKKEGINTVEKTLGEIKEALNAGPDEYGRYGLYWNMWPFDACTNTRVSIKVYEVEGFEGVGYQDPITSAIKNVEVSAQNAAMYNVAGQRVQNAKGLVIINGKKYIK